MDHLRRSSAPDLRCHVANSDSRTLSADFQAWFGDWANAVAALSLRECAIAKVADIDALAIAGIDLPVDVASAEPLALRSFHSDALQPIVGDALPFCFAVPQVRFGVLWERLLIP